MTVRELKEKLENVDPEMLVIIPGYEGGWQEVGAAEVVNTKLNVRNDIYQGPHEVYDEKYPSWFEDYPGKECLTFLID